MPKRGGLFEAEFLKACDSEEVPGPGREDCEDGTPASGASSSLVSALRGKGICRTGGVDAGTGDPRRAVERLREGDLVLADWEGRELEDERPSPGRRDGERESSAIATLEAQ